MITMANEEKSFQKESINWFPGHMAKTRRKIGEKLNLIDIVYEVVDARMPLSSKIVDLDALIKNKPRILIMTKYDLCDKKVTDSMISYYEKKGYFVVAVDLMTGKNVSEIICLSENILKEENEKRKEKGLKPRTLRALIVGVPNVGKSTLINRLAGKKAASVGNRPGVTKNLGWIRLNKDIELLDTPGILWPKFENQDYAKNLALLSSIKEEIVNKEDLVFYALDFLKKYYPSYLEKRYGFSVEGMDNLEILDQIAKKRGALSKGGITDYEKVYNILLQDIRNGLLGEITLDRLA